MRCSVTAVDGMEIEDTGIAKGGGGSTMVYWFGWRSAGVRLYRGGSVIGAG